MDRGKWLFGWIIAALVIVGGYRAFNRNVHNAAEPIRVGAILPLTGARADGGEFGRNGLAIAEGEINADSRRKYKIEFIYEDSKYEPQTAVTAFQKLKGLDGVKYIVGAYGSSETLAIAPLAEQSKIILMTPASQSDEISESGDYIFRIIHNAAQEAPVFARFVAGKMKGDTIHFLAQNTDITPSYLKNFRPIIEQAGKKVGLVEKFEAKTADFKTHLSKLKERKPTDIFLIAIPKHAGLILKQAAELGMQAQFYNIGVEGPDIVSIAGTEAEGLLYPYSYDSQSDEEEVRSFYRKYLERYGKSPDTVAANAYDIAYLLSDCFEKNGDDVEKTKRCLYGTKDYRGAGGKFTFDENGDAIKQFIVKTIENGQFVKYRD